MECCCYLRNVQDLLADGKTPYDRGFGEPFKGPVIIRLHRKIGKDSSIWQENITRNLPGHEVVAG